MAQKRKKTRSRGACDAKDNIDNCQTVLWTSHAIVEGLKECEGVEASEDEKKACAEDKNISQLRRDHDGCCYWWDCHLPYMRAVLRENNVKCEP